MRKILFILLFLCIGFASALEVQQDNVDNAIITDFTQPAVTTLTITNAEPGQYAMYTLTDVKLIPATPFYLGAGTNTIVASVFPTADLVARGTIGYNFQYTIKDLDRNKFYDSTMAIRVLNLEDAVYVSSDSNSPDTDKISFYVYNREKIELKNVHVRFSSIFFDVEETFNLLPYEKKEFSISVDSAKLKKIEAGSYLLKAEFKTDKGSKFLEGRIYLGEKKGIETKEEVKGFFIRTDTVTKTNYGNVVENVSVEMSKDIFSRLFTSFNIEPTVANRDAFMVNYMWSKKLMPTEQLVIKSSTSYFLPMLIALALILVIIAFKRFTERKVEVIKSATPLKTKSGQFALRIRINVKAKRDMENVSLVERVPRIVNIHEQFGTIRPDKIDTVNKRLQWNLGDLRAGEERAFSYVVYSNLGVVGKFSLPPSLVVFERSGQIHEAESNTVFVLSEQSSKDD